MANNDTTDLKLAQVFATKAFRIPDYQRGYAWGERQWNDLWEDIWDMTEDNISKEYQPHFTGTITLKEINKDAIPLEELWFRERGNNFYDVVDGQQRLTTLEILLFELIKCYPDNEEKEDLRNAYLFKSRNTTNTRFYLFSYNKNDKNRTFLLNHIFEDSTVIVQDGYVNVYTNNLSAAKTWFGEHISQLSDEKKRDLLRRIQTALVFDIKYISNNVSEQAVFETMNNRGKPLSILEKLKNRLLFLTAKLPNPQEDRIELSKKVNDAWRKIYDYLGKNPQKMLDEDEFLSAHLTLIREPEYYSFSEQVAEKKVFEMFCVRANQYFLKCTKATNDDEREPIVDFFKISNYVQNMADFVPYWYEVYNSDDLRIKKILLLNGSKEMRILLATLLSFRNQQDDLVNKCIDLLLKVEFRNCLPSMSVVDERTYATRARELHNQEESLEDFHNKIEQLLNIGCNVEGMIGQFKSLFEYERGKKGFHRWNGLKFFLMEFEQHLHIERYKNDNPRVIWDNFNALNIEHVLPQSFCNNWNDTMTKYISGKELSDDEKHRAEKIIVNTLGNLTILRDSKNSELQNDPWTIKCARYKAGSFSELAISEKEVWDGCAIRERGIEMIDFLASMVQGLSFTEQQKEELLFVSDKYFVKSPFQQDENILI